MKFKCSHCGDEKIDRLHRTDDNSDWVCQSCFIMFNCEKTPQTRWKNEI